MGDAKRRGTPEQRLLQAKARIDALKPRALICNHCQSEISEIHVLDSKGMSGIEAAFAGICDKCTQTTWALMGNQEAVALAMDALQEEMGVGLIGRQPFDS